MYALRSVRIDPSSTTTADGGGGGTGDMGYRSNRLSVAEATARLGLGRVGSTTAKTMMEISLLSFPGTDGPTDEEWEAEFRRVASEMLTSSSTLGLMSSAKLFSADFASVPSPPRLAAWLAEKWAPAVLRSYDIAGIRAGPRPVYASVVPRRNDSNNEDGATVETVWQDLVDFAPVTSGRMYIKVGSTGIAAMRGPGNESSLAG